MRGGTIAVVIGAALLLAACGGDDDDGGGPSLPASAQPYVDAVVRSGVASGFTQEQAACIAPRWVATMGVDRVEAAGLAPEDLAAADSDIAAIGLDDDEAGHLYDALGDCDVDLVDVFARELVGADATEAQLECVSDQIDDDVVRDAMVAGIVGDEAEAQSTDEVFGAVFSAAEECGIATP